MGETTGIAWCHHTFNPWWGCVEVSPACDHCYARQDAWRYGHAVWGTDAPRRFFSDQHWNEPLRWDRKAAAAGARRRVFCASMADVFEERHDAVGREMDRARERLWRLIASTPSLDWLLLTKRPAGMRRLLPSEIAELPSVWPGVTVESADYIWRVAELLDIEAAGRRWISYEPILGPVDFSMFLAPRMRPDRRIAWIIAGGESQGPPARRLVTKTCVGRTCLDACRCGGTGFTPTSEGLAWIRGVRDQCVAAGTAFFFKQWGGPRPDSGGHLVDGREWREMSR